MDDHTPTPWEVMPSETWHHLNSGNAPSSVFHIGDYTVVTDTPSYEFHAEDSADAAFIVKAVNNHYALTKALSLALYELTACARQLKARDGGSVDLALKAARDALDRVGGSGT